MAIIGKSYFDLINLYKTTNPDGSISDVIEMLSEMNPILQDAIAMECNQGATHMHTVRTGLPDVTWGQLYKGVPNSKSTTAQVTDTTGFLEGRSEVDTRLLKLSGNSAAVRLSEATSFLEAMAQEAASQLFYGNTAVEPTKFMGLTPRFNSLSAPNGKQIIDGGGTSNANTSIWFVAWGDNQCHLLYPQGTQAGVDREDKGQQLVRDANGDSYFVEMEQFTWHMGLAVKDWRYVARVANIDIDDLRDGNVDVYGLMLKAMYRMQSRIVAGGKVCIYCNRDVMEALDALGTNKGANDNFIRLTPSEVEGKEVLNYRGMPVRESDAILNTEQNVT